MRTVSICVASALALGFVQSHALAQSPPPTPRPNQGEVEQARNTFIFQFDGSVSRDRMPARAQQIVARAGGTLRHVYDNVVGGFAATIPGAAAWRVAGEPHIIAYQRDEIDTIVAKPVRGGGSVSGQTIPWGIERIKAAGSTNTGANIDVYVIDTGIDLSHGDLYVNAGESWSCFRSCTLGGNDDHGHGTHVAGTIGAKNNGQDVVGVAPAITLHAVKVLKKNGIGFHSDIIAGINKVAGEAVRKGKPVVANLSLGGSGKKTGTCNAGVLSGSTDSYRKAFCEAAGKGVVFVVAAGNSGADAENYAPASYDDAVITVSATNKNDDWPSWSNWGNNPSNWGVTSAPVAIAAPGVSILSTRMGGGTTTMSGTSMASPHVAGIAALLLKSSACAADYSAFVKIRAAVLSGAEATFSTNTSGNVHSEKFVNHGSTVACPPQS